MAPPPLPGDDEPQDFIVIDNLFIEHATKHSETFTYGQARLGKPLKGLGLVPKFATNFEMKVGFYYSVKVLISEFRGEKQIRIEEIIDERPPMSSDGLKKFFLGFESIGPVKAEKIVEGLGEDAFKMIMADCSCLHEWVKEDIALEIKENLTVDPEKAEIKRQLMGIGVSKILIEKIFHYHDKATIDVVKNNPYLLIHIEGIGFRTADSIAIKIGNVDLDDPKRLEQIALHIAKNLIEGDSGDTVFTFDTIRLKCRKALGTINSFSVDKLIERVEEMIEDGTFKVALTVKGEDWYQTTESFFDEKSISSSMATRVGKYDLNDIDIEKIKSRIVQMSHDQLSAINGIMEENVSILTGGPGTGKSFITNSAKIAMRTNGLSVTVVAPTGKAAARVGGVTIHRALGWGSGGVWGPNKEISSDVLIVDECSMIDNDLMLSLLSMTPKDTKIIMVGDPEQLPPIGKGEPFKQFIKSGKVPTFTLTTIHRQDGESAIPYVAEQIKNGKMITVEDESVVIIADSKMERRSVEITDSSMDDDDGGYLELLSQRLVNTYLSMMISSKKSGTPIPIEDIMILVPYSSTRMKPNTTDINGRIQEFRFRGKPDKYIINKGKKRLAIGDRVIRTKNRMLELYDDDGEVVNILNANGDCGVITGGGEDSFFVRYDRDDIPGDVLIPSKEFSEIQLAYALTVHKAQGSDSKYVIIAAHSSNRFIFDRRAFYTAVTRAKEAVVIVTPSLKDAHSLYSRRPQDRKSLISHRIKTFKKQEDGSSFVSLSEKDTGKKLVRDEEIFDSSPGSRKLNI